MAEQYPFVLGNVRLGALLDAIGTAAKPPRFSQEFLRTLGFTGSNDRAFVPLFRRLGFTEDNGTPTEKYDHLRDKQLRAKALAESIRNVYADIFSINTNIQSASDDEVKGAISRVTGKDAQTVQRYFNTFRALTNLADFKATKLTAAPVPKFEEAQQDPVSPEVRPNARNISGFHYNIQIHLPATSDISVYNAIFRALKDNLVI